jgi:hypothetical protein
MALLEVSCHWQGKGVAVSMGGSKDLDVLSRLRHEARDKTREAKGGGRRRLKASGLSGRT